MSPYRIFLFGGLVLFLCLGQWHPERKEPAGLQNLANAGNIHTGTEPSRNATALGSLRSNYPSAVIAGSVELIHRSVAAMTSSFPVNTQTAAEFAEAIVAENGVCDSEEQDEDLETFAAALSPGELQRRLDELNTKSPEWTLAKEVLLRQWAISDPLAAANWAKQIPPGPWRDAADKQLVLGWVATDPAAAWEYANTIADAENRNEVLSDLAYETVSANAPVAIEIANRLTPGAGRDDLLVHAVSEWALADRSLALEWAESVEDALLRERLVAAIALGTAKVDGRESATLIANRLRPGQQQLRAAVAIAQSWAQSDGTAASEWIAQFPESEVKTAASRALHLQGQSQCDDQ